MEFVCYCLMPHLIRLEEKFNRKLFRNDESGEYYYLVLADRLAVGRCKDSVGILYECEFCGDYE